MICPFRKKYYFAKETDFNKTVISTEFEECYEERCPFYVPAESEYGHDLCMRCAIGTDEEV